MKWLPVTWCCQLIQSARDEGFIDTEPEKEALLRELLNVQRQCCTLLEWHQYNVPLIYTQVSASVTELQSVGDGAMPLKFCSNVALFRIYYEGFSLDFVL